jgi:hypothetical protein
VAFVDEITEFIGRAEPARRRVIICDLITPGTFEWMLGNWQQFNMRVTHFQYVRQQRLNKLEITQLAISFLRFATPRAQVHFVNADRASRPVARPARFHPRAIVPAVTFQIVHQRCGGFSVLIKECERIAFEK